MDLWKFDGGITFYGERDTTRHVPIEKIESVLGYFPLFSFVVSRQVSLGVIRNFTSVVIDVSLNPLRNFQLSLTLLDKTVLHKSPLHNPRGRRLS